MVVNRITSPTLLLYSVSLCYLMKGSSQAGYDFYFRKQHEKKLPLRAEVAASFLVSEEEWTSGCTWSHPPFSLHSQPAVVQTWLHGLIWTYWTWEAEPSSQRDKLQKSFLKVSKIKPFLIAIKEKVGSIKRNPVQYSHLQKLSQKPLIQSLASFKGEHTVQKTYSHALGWGWGGW